VGSFGTLGVIARVTLRCQPRPAASMWCTTEIDPFAIRGLVLRPVCIRTDGATTHVLLEGEAADVASDLKTISAHECAPPPWPAGIHRGRISVASADLGALVARLRATGAEWVAELGVGTVHVGAQTPDALLAARDAAHAVGGWLLREAGAPDIYGFGVALPNAALMRRIRDAFDPTGKFAPGRLPFAVEAVRA
jgi:FAD/FMN-containing dehydrogenase